MAEALNDRQRHDPVPRISGRNPSARPYPSSDSPGEFAKRAVDEFFARYEKSKSAEESSED